MGSWLMKYFSKKRAGPLIRAYDIDSHSLNTKVGDIQSSGHIKICTTIEESVKSADVVFVCVPVQITHNVIELCVAKMRAGSIIAEISSVKGTNFNALQKLPTFIRPLSIHPMFGPGLRDNKCMKILLVPVRDKDIEVKILAELFEEALIKVVPGPKKHDRAIALVLGLTYLTNIVFARILSSEDLLFLKEISGKTFGLQSLLCESVLTDEPDLVLALLKENRFALGYFEKYAKELSIIIRSLESKNNQAIRKKLIQTRSDIKKQNDIQLSYEKMYEIAGKL